MSEDEYMSAIMDGVHRYRVLEYAPQAYISALEAIMNAIQRWECNCWSRLYKRWQKHCCRTKDFEKAEEALKILERAVDFAGQIGCTFTYEKAGRLGQPRPSFIIDSSRIKEWYGNIHYMKNNKYQ